jgi:hypothetical protein
MCRYLFCHKVGSEACRGVGNLVYSKADGEKWLLIAGVWQSFIKLGDRNHHMALITAGPRDLDVELGVHRRRLCNKGNNNYNTRDWRLQ